MPTPKSKSEKKNKPTNQSNVGTLRMKVESSATMNGKKIALTQSEDPMAEALAIADIALLAAKWESKGYTQPGALCSIKLLNEFKAAGFDINSINERVKKTAPKMTQEKFMPLIAKSKQFFAAYEAKDFKKGKQLAEEIVALAEK